MFGVKEVLIEIRDDVRGLKRELAQKADRDRVHQIGNDIAAIRLEMSERQHIATEFLEYRARTESRMEKIEAKLLVAWGAWAVLSFAFVGYVLRTWTGLG